MSKLSIILLWPILAVIFLIGWVFYTIDKEPKLQPVTGSCYQLHFSLGEQELANYQRDPASY